MAVLVSGIAKISFVFFYKVEVEVYTSQTKPIGLCVTAGGNM